jgi:hypothetical protein
MHSDVAMGKVVTIIIGPEKKAYSVHKGLICYYSEYFRTVHNGQWKEAEDGVSLDMVEPIVFNIFLHWLYMQRLPDTLSEIYSISGGVAGELDRCLLSLLKSCVFGDRFLVPRFHNVVHNLFVDLHQGPPWLPHIHYAFENLAEDDSLLEFLVEAQCLFWDPRMDDEDEIAARKLLPQAFLVQTMVRFSTLSSYGIDPNDTIMLCDYHRHDSAMERIDCCS